VHACLGHRVFDMFMVYGLDQGHKVQARVLVEALEGAHASAARSGSDGDVKLR
jgi:hypothetical protein